RDQVVTQHPLTVRVPQRLVLPAPRLARGWEEGRERGAYARQLKLLIEARVGADERADPGGGIAPHRLVAAPERLDEAANRIRLIRDRAPAHYQHELVIRGHADLLHADHVRVLAALGEFERLDVPIAAERRV